jgi:hypothetical protein
MRVTRHPSGLHIAMIPHRGGFPHPRTASGQEMRATAAKSTATRMALPNRELQTPLDWWSLTGTSEVEETIMDRNFFDQWHDDWPMTTPLQVLDPAKIRILQVPMNTMARYQRQMSKAVWKPAPGRKLGFFVIHDDALLGLIALASPVIRLKVRDDFLFPNAPYDFDYGRALRSYMDMSVCVAAQPIGWHWRLGKLLAMLATTLGPEIEQAYPDDEFKGIVTTGLYGHAAQYNRIYKFLGYTEGFGHEHISDADYASMVQVLTACHALPGCKFEDGSNAKMRRIAAYRKLTGDKTTTLHHGHRRGVYYHDAVTEKSEVKS